MLFWFHFMHIQSIIKDLIFFSIPGVWDLPPYSLHKLSWKDQHSLSLSWYTRHWWKQRCSMYIFGNILLWIKTFFLYNSLDCSPCSCEIMITILHFTINKKRKNLLLPHLVWYWHWCKMRCTMSHHHMWESRLWQKKHETFIFWCNERSTK